MNALTSAIDKYNKLHKVLLGSVEYSMPDRPSLSSLERLDMTFGEFLEQNELQAIAPFLSFAHAAQGYGYVASIPALYGLWWVSPELLNGYVPRPPGERAEVVAANSSLAPLLAQLRPDVDAPIDRGDYAHEQRQLVHEAADPAGDAHVRWSGRRRRVPDDYNAPGGLQQDLGDHRGGGATRREAKRGYRSHRPQPGRLQRARHDHSLRRGASRVRLPRVHGGPRPRAQDRGGPHERGDQDLREAPVLRAFDHHLLEQRREALLERGHPRAHHVQRGQDAGRRERWPVVRRPQRHAGLWRAQEQRHADPGRLPVLRGPVRGGRSPLRLRQNPRHQVRAPRTKLFQLCFLRLAHSL